MIGSIEALKNRVNRRTIEDTFLPNAKAICGQLTFNNDLTPDFLPKKLVLKVMQDYGENMEKKGFHPLPQELCLYLALNATESAIRLAALQSFNIYEGWDFNVSKKNSYRVGSEFGKTKGKDTKDTFKNVFDLDEPDKTKYFKTNLDVLHTLAKFDTDKNVRSEATRLYVEIARFTHNSKIGVQNPVKLSVWDNLLDITDNETNVDAKGKKLKELTVIVTDPDIMIGERFTVQSNWEERMKEFIDNRAYSLQALDLIREILISPYKGFEKLKFNPQFMFTLDNIKNIVLTSDEITKSSAFTKAEKLLLEIINTPKLENLRNQIINAVLETFLNAPNSVSRN